MITDDPGTPGDGHWEINFAGTGRWTDSGSESELPLLDFNYGVGDRIQLKYEVPWVWLREYGEGSRSGLGNSSIGVKWRFFDAGDAGWQVSTFPSLEFRNPASSSAERGIANDGTSLVLPFEFLHAFGPVGIDFEIGHEFVSNDADAWKAGIVVGKQVSGRLEVLAEVHGEADESLNESSLAINFGLSWDISDSGSLLVSCGHELHNGLEEKANVFGYVAWQARF